MKAPRRLSVTIPLLLLSASLLLGSCSKGEEPVPAPLYLLDQSWQLTELDGKAASASVGNAVASLTLSSVDNLSTGQAWCNQYDGRFMLVPGTSFLTFTDQASTRVSCSDQQQETRYLTLMTQVRRYTISHRHLQLFDSEHEQPLLVFEVK